MRDRATVRLENESDHALLWGNASGLYYGHWGGSPPPRRGFMRDRGTLFLENESDHELLWGNASGVGGGSFTPWALGDGHGHGHGHGNVAGSLLQGEGQASLRETAFATVLRLGAMKVSMPDYVFVFLILLFMVAGATIFYLLGLSYGLFPMPDDMLRMMRKGMAQPAGASEDRPAPGSSSEEYATTAPQGSSSEEYATTAPQGGSSSEEHATTAPRRGSSSEEHASTAPRRNMRVPTFAFQEPPPADPVPQLAPGPFQVTLRPSSRRPAPERQSSVNSFVSMGGTRHTDDTGGMFASAGRELRGQLMDVQRRSHYNKNAEARQHDPPIAEEEEESEAEEK